MTRRVAEQSLVLGAAAALSAATVAIALWDWDNTWGILALPIIAFLAGRTPTRLVGGVAVGLLFGGIAAGQLINFDNDGIVPEIMLPATFYAAGLVLRGRETLAGRLADQGEELAAERDAYAQLSVRYERARIAAELHDVVAHAISVMVVQASAGQRLAVRDPERAAQTFGVIAGAARQAQADLGRLADLLAQEEAPEPGADLALVHEVVEAAAASGLPVSLTVRGDPAEVPSAVAHAALRVVQEGLTNALRYAPGAGVAVTVEILPASLELRVVNDAPVAAVPLGLGSGRGLDGLRERVGALGGVVQAGAERDGGWYLLAAIPLTRHTAAQQPATRQPA